MPGDELAGRRAARDGGGLEFGPDGGWRFRSEALEARGEHVLPAYRNLGAQLLSGLDEWLKWVSDGGCAETGGVHVEAALCGAVAEGLKLAQELARRRDGGGEPVPGLAALVSQLTGAARGTPVDSMDGAASSPFCWVAAGEAAALMGCGPRQARHLARQGKIRARKLGRDWLFDRQAAEDYGRRSRGA